MGRLLVITGPPGAGKSAASTNIAARFDRSVVVTGDSFFGFLASGKKDPWLAEAHEQNETVIRAAAAATARYVQGGNDTIYDGILGPWFLPSFLGAAGLESLNYVILLPPADICVERILRPRDHDFADETATRRTHRGFTQAEIDQRHVISDVTASPRDTADLVLSACQAGALTYNLL